MGSKESAADLRLRFTKTHLLPKSTADLAFYRHFKDSTIARSPCLHPLPALRTHCKSLVVEHNYQFAGNRATLHSVTVLVGEFPALCPASCAFKLVVGCLN